MVVRGGQAGPSTGLGAGAQEQVQRDDESRHHGGGHEGPESPPRVLTYQLAREEAMTRPAGRATSPGGGGRGGGRRR